MKEKQIGILEETGKRIYTFFLAVPKWLLISILLICYFTHLAPTANEENNFGQTLQFLNPNWIPDSLSFTDSPGNRVILQYMVAPVLSFLSFEAVSVLGRILNSILLAIPVGLILKRLQINNYFVVVLMVLFYLPLQSFFAEEWIFGGFESKTLAYVFVFFSVYFLLTRRTFLCGIFAALASYFHVLVGGWFFLSVILFLFLDRRALVEIIKLGALYLLIILPFVYYLGREILFDEGVATGTVNLDWVYVYFRNPHHTGIFASLVFFLKVHATGVVLFLLSFLLSIYLYSTTADDDSRILFKMQTSFFLFLLFFLLIALVDRGGRILKFYPFRLCTLYTFFFYVSVAHFAVRAGKSENVSRQTQTFVSLLLLLGIVWFGYRTLEGYHESWKKVSENSSYKKLIAYARENTEPRDRFIFPDKVRGFHFVDFPRRAKRDRFAVWKFVPVKKRYLYEWYIRIGELEKVNSDPKYILALKEKYRIDFVVTEQMGRFDFLPLFYSNTDFLVYKVE
jgi:hypothetical protein